MPVDEPSSEDPFEDPSVEAPRLFADPAVGRQPEPTFTVAELGSLVAHALVRAFPDEVWVTGEVHDLARPPSGHVYFSLVGRDEWGVTAQVPVMLSSRVKPSVNRTLRDAGGAVRMTDGTEVRIRGRLDWYARRGQLQLRMTAIDPAYTLGQLALARTELLARLEAEDLLEANRHRPMPLVPLRVALVTSTGSAAEADVLDELGRSGFAFEVTTYDCRVQGTSAPASVAAAVRAAGEAVPAPDVILLVRGGGARTDLAAFDQELVARAVATAPVPVVTGIGHETDRCVADEVAHTAAKTPTASAQVVVARVAELVHRLDAAWAGIVRCAVHGLDEAAGDLRARAGRVGRSTRTAVLATRQALDAATARVGAGARSGLVAAEERTVRGAGRAHAAARVHLRGAEAAMAVASRRLAHAGPRAVTEAERHLGSLRARVRAHDPALVLARGWSITRRADGTVVRDPGQVGPGDELSTLVAGGELRSVVSRPAATRSDDVP